MQRAASDRRRGRVFAVCGLLAPLLAAALPAAAGAREARLADRICSAAPGRSAAAPFPRGEALVAVAVAAERDIARLRRSGDPSAADRVPLSMPTDSEEAPPDAALALYCAAAGEAMRLGANGSQAQAVNFLLAAYRKAEEAGLDDLAALAAYRLALVGGTGGASADTRGGVATDIPAEGAAVPDALACAELRDVRLAAISLDYLSVLALECAADRSVAIGDGRLAALANLRLSRVEAGLADIPGADRAMLIGAARTRIARALPGALALSPAQGRTTLTARLVETALDLGGGVSPLLVGAVRSLGNSDDPDAAPVAAALNGRLAIERGDLAAARNHYRAAIVAESRRPLPQRLPLYYLGLAEADAPQRSEHVRAAYAALENVRPLLPRFDPVTEESVFSLAMRDVYIAAVEDRLGGTTDAADEAARIREAQTIVEAYRQAELQSAFGSECLPPRQAARPEDLQPGEILLYPLLLADRLELIYVVGGDGAGGAPRYRRLPPDREADRARITRLVEDVVLAMSARDDDRWRAPARQLHALLIAPIADQLGPGSILAIVPDGPLRALPFAALIAPDGRYLVEQTRLSLIPALAYSAPEGVRAGDALNVVAASLQRQISLPVGFFPELAGTSAEAQIAVSFADRGRFVPNFNRADLEAALDGGRVDVLHLATHATFNGRSDRAFIVANGEVIRLSELRELIERTRTRGEPLDLIVLSACETAVGDDETSMGLAGAAVQAGARSVIGSLWQVSDTGTAELMGQFYRRYSAGQSRSEALREAQLALIAAGGANADPSIWAAFALLGAWR